MAIKQDINMDDLLKENARLRETVDRLATSAQDLQLDKCYFEAILKSAVEGMLVVRQDGTVSTVNPEAKRMLGIEGDVADLEGLGRGRGGEIARFLGEILKSNMILHREIRISDGCGGEGDERDVYVRLNAAPILDWGGRQAGLVAVLHDITEEKETEKMKAEFVSMVSHEIRSPLTVTRESVKILLEGLAGEINKKQEEILVRTEKNADRLLRLVNDILDLSKLESGRIELHKEKVDAAKVVKETIAFFESRANALGLDLNAEIEGGIIVDADADKLSQIITNLISNSIKFTKHGRITIIVEDKGGVVEFAVQDTGDGMAPEDIPRLFDKFRQFGHKSTTGEKGTGLGLSIVKQLVEAHDGKIWVESKQGEGTRFTFEIPKQEA